MKKQRASGATKAPAGNLNISLVQHIPALILELGYDPNEVFNQIELDADAFNDPQSHLAYEAFGRLLSFCVQYCQCPNFGLLIGQRFELESMAMLGMLLRNAPTVEVAMQIGQQHMQLNDRGAVASIVPIDATQVAMTFTLLNGSIPASDQIIDAASVIHIKVLQNLCGPNWQPNCVCLAHKQPKDVSQFHDVFGKNIEFNAEMSTIVFDIKWLKSTIHGANTELFNFIVKTINQRADNYSHSFSDRVRRALHPMILMGGCASEIIAQRFEINERTLRRKLKLEGVTLRELENEVRCQLSCQLLRDTNLDIKKIAEIMGYSDGQIFARAFRTWMKMSPTDWRNAGN